MAQNYWQHGWFQNQTKRTAVFQIIYIKIIKKLLGLWTFIGKIGPSIWWFHEKFWAFLRRDQIWPNDKKLLQKSWKTKSSTFTLLQGCFPLMVHESDLVMVHGICWNRTWKISENVSPTSCTKKETCYISTRKANDPLETALFFEWICFSEDMFFSPMNKQKLGGGFKHFFYFHHYLGKIPILTNIFQRGWNHQLEKTYEKQTHFRNWKWNGIYGGLRVQWASMSNGYPVTHCLNGLRQGEAISWHISEPCPSIVLFQQ